MASINKKKDPIYTHGGGKASHIKPEEELRRSVLACLLWEDQFYESGKSISERIIDLCRKVDDIFISNLASEAREEQHLRHVPLLLCRELARKRSKFTANTLYEVIQRADELTEFLALYWQNGRCPLSAQIKKGLAKAFTKFDEYQLAKYNRNTDIKLKDVLFLCHAKPKNKDQEELWKRLINDELTVPNTWETRLSSGENKRETFTDLINNRKIGGLAFLRNLRNMTDAGISKEILSKGFETANFSKVLPFRFISAAKACPKHEDLIDKQFLQNAGQNKIPGTTLLVIDVSGSMYGGRVSKNSDMDRAVAACALGAVIRECCENPIIYATAGNDCTRVHDTALVPNRRGMSLVDAIYKMCSELGGGGIFLNQVCKYIDSKEKGVDIDRMIVITDEQDCSRPDDSPDKATPLGKNNYMINISSYDRGIAYGKWTHITGWSESVINYIREIEKPLN